jgi:hypothetical protein
MPHLCLSAPATLCFVESQAGCWSRTRLERFHRQQNFIDNHTSIFTNKTHSHTKVTSRLIYFATQRWRNRRKHTLQSNVKSQPSIDKQRPQVLESSRIAAPQPTSQDCWEQSRKQFPFRQVRALNIRIWSTSACSKSRITARKRSGASCIRHRHDCRRYSSLNIRTHTTLPRTTAA